MRRSCVMHTTSFMANSGSKSDDEDENVNKQSNHTGQPPPEYSQLVDHKGNDVSYRTHQKRASYHLMKPIYYEDGNVIIADI
jgi:hypothetical protein